MTAISSTTVTFDRSLKDLRSRQKDLIGRRGSEGLIQCVRNTAVRALQNIELLYKAATGSEFLKGRDASTLSYVCMQKEAERADDLVKALPYSNDVAMIKLFASQVREFSEKYRCLLSELRELSVQISLLKPVKV